jgi:hypothetical protein
MDGFIEAFIVAIAQVLAELGFSKTKKVPDSKKIPFKHSFILIIGIAVFFAITSVLMNWILNTLAKLFS